MFFSNRKEIKLQISKERQSIKKYMEDYHELRKLLKDKRFSNDERRMIIFELKQTESNINYSLLEIDILIEKL